MKRFDGDVFLQIQADIWRQNMGKMASECVRCMREHAVGVYAPALDFTPHASPRPGDCIQGQSRVCYVPGEIRKRKC